MDRTLFLMLAIALLLISSLSPSAVFGFGLTLALVILVTWGAWTLMQSFSSQRFPSGQQMAEIEVLD